MEKVDYKDMIKGWFVGGFNPTALQTVDKVRCTYFDFWDS